VAERRRYVEGSRARQHELVGERPQQTGVDERDHGTRIEGFDLTALARDRPDHRVRAASMSN
jgi:hypothetical protein